MMATTPNGSNSVSFTHIYHLPYTFNSVGIFNYEFLCKHNKKVITSGIFKIFQFSYFIRRTKASSIRTNCFNVLFSSPLDPLFSAECLICFLLPSKPFHPYLLYFRGKWTIWRRAFKPNSVLSSSSFSA